ncbi:unnamed protein product [Cuscuta europaea]|uniref:Uncharacterized protein n=1 Tax=Cuscuta europaea TaxID=41803 RepID=A0A9P1EGG2_CUSEU|nr:unnamed protein product [Cuscuta europaea]
MGRMEYYYYETSKIGLNMNNFIYNNILLVIVRFVMLRMYISVDGVYGSEPQDPHTQKNRKHKTLSGALVGQGTPVGRKGTNSEYGPEAKEPGCPRRPRPRRPRRPHRTRFHT